MRLLVISDEAFIALRRYLIDTGGKGTQHVVALDEASQDGVYFLRTINEARASCANSVDILIKLRESVNGL